MKTEFNDLDKIINLEQSNLILVGGRPAMGKTTFALNIINDIALKQEIPTLFFSLELSKKSIINDITDKLYIDDTANVTIEYIEEQCKRLKQSNDIRFVVIDYLQLINCQQDMEKVGTRLKALTEELNLTILVLSQLSKELEKRENKRPIITDLGISKVVANIADIVMFLYREKYYNIEADDTLEIIVAKK